MFTPFTLNIRGRIERVSRPMVCGILNATPDSFFEESRTCANMDMMCRLADKMISEGADMIDVGAYSSRPGAEDVPVQEEVDRLGSAFEALRKVGADGVVLSVDTFRAEVAKHAVAMGADIINDISGGDLDNDMFDMVAGLRVPYILMHMRGNPSTMSELSDYTAQGGVTAAVISDLSTKVARLSSIGVNDVIVDPGFGFAKTVRQNYELLRNISTIGKMLKRPVLAGMSRKSMLTRVLGITPGEALEATTVVNTVALMGGCSILRVHDVKAARQAVELVGMLSDHDREQTNCNMM